MISPFGVEHGMKCDVHGEISKACWDNYRQKGMKIKGGRMVPNCVPKKGKK